MSASSSSSSSPCSGVLGEVVDLARVQFANWGPRLSSKSTVRGEAIPLPDAFLREFFGAGGMHAPLTEAEDNARANKGVRSVYYDEASSDSDDDENANAGSAA